MEQNKEYYAFISYSHKDEEWAKWLQHEFEHYHLPTTLNGLTDLPDKFRPIFRDIDELSGGELKPQISYALRASAYLVIICSPNSAKSPYVDGEILEFIEIGEKNGINNIGNIFPFIVDGVPHSKEEQEKECFLVYGFIDCSGNLVIPRRFLEAGDFKDGYAEIKDCVETRCKYVDKDGNLI